MTRQRTATKKAVTQIEDQYDYEAAYTVAEYNEAANNSYSTDYHRVEDALAGYTKAIEAYRTSPNYVCGDYEQSQWLELTGHDLHLSHDFKGERATAVAPVLDGYTCKVVGTVAITSAGGTYKLATATTLCRMINSHRADDMSLVDIQHVPICNVCPITVYADFFCPDADGEGIMWRTYHIDADGYVEDTTFAAA